MKQTRTLDELMDHWTLQQDESALLAFHATNSKCRMR